MLLAVPDGIRLSLTVPDTVYAGEPTPAIVEFKLKASLAVDIIAQQSNYMLPHINIHSCFASIGACTPFIKNNPELSTHTPAVSRNLTTSVTSSGDWTLTESIEITLDEGSYMIIGHSPVCIHAYMYIYSYVCMVGAWPHIYARAIYICVHIFVFTRRYVYIIAWWTSRFVTNIIGMVTGPHCPHCPRCPYCRACEIFHCSGQV